MTSENWKKVGKGFLIAVGSAAGTAALAFVSAHYTEMDFGKYTMQVQAGIAVLIVIVKEYMKSRQTADVTIDRLPDEF